MAAASTGGMTASSTRCAVRTSAIAATAAAVAWRPTIAAVTIRGPRLHDGLPHVELRTRITSAVAAGSRPMRITRTRRGSVPVASALPAARGRRAALAAPGGVATVRWWREGLPLAPVGLAVRGRLRRRLRTLSRSIIRVPAGRGCTGTRFAGIRARRSRRRRSSRLRFRSTRLCDR